jgi:[CysO sulfur-carrier protein]-S-L-cysteine hydrolase
MPKAEVGGLCLNRRLRDRMVQHARQADPMEAVGILGGLPPGQVVEVIPLENLAGPDHFLADPYEQYRAERDLRSAGLTPLAVYHSHPAGGVALSALDVRFAAGFDLIQVVIALNRPGRAAVDLKAFRLRGGRPVEVDLSLTDQQP